SLMVLTMTLAAMPATRAVPVWAVLRLLAGVTSAVVFVIAASALLSNQREHPPSFAGWGFGGVGAGIALSGLLVLVLRAVGDWRWPLPNLLFVALVVQAVGIALPALLGGLTAALVSAALFGATFLGVSTIALATGVHLQFPRSVPLLTAGYSVGQILGPLAA